MKHSEIKQNRLDMKISQSQLALLFGVTYQTIDNWERGRSEPNQVQQAILMQLKNKYESYLKINKQDEFASDIKFTIIYGGMLKFMIWLFKKGTS